MIVKVWMATCPNPYCPRADIRMIFKTKADPVLQAVIRADSKAAGRKRQ